jgi:hypothetical protein
MSKFDARVTRRIYMRKPAPASLSDRRVEVLDLSATGVGIRHAFPLQRGAREVLEFRWEIPLTLQCVVVRSRVVPGGFHTGLAIERCPREYRERVAEAVERKRREELNTPSQFDLRQR